MTLQASGLITAEDINIELGRAASAPFSLGGVDERALADVASGAISFADFYSKSSGGARSEALSITVGSAFTQGVTQKGFISDNSANQVFVGSVSSYDFDGNALQRVVARDDNVFSFELLNGGNPIPQNYFDTLVVDGLGSPLLSSAASYTSIERIGFGGPDYTKWTWTGPPTWLAAEVREVTVTGISV